MVKQHKRKRLSREDRKVEIMIACEKMRRGGKAATVHSVAKEIGYSASTLLRTMMNELVELEVLDCFVGEHWNGEPRKTYIPDMDFIRSDFPTLYDMMIAKLGEQERLF